MGENKTNSNTPGSSDIEKIFKERERLEQVLREQRKLSSFSQIFAVTQNISISGAISAGGPCS